MAYSRDEAIRDLQAIGDAQRSRGPNEWPVTEDDHCEADDILLRLIGDPEVKAAFDRIEKWYA